MGLVRWVRGVLVLAAIVFAARLGRLVAGVETIGKLVGASVERAEAGATWAIDELPATLTAGVIEAALAGGGLEAALTRGGLEVAWRGEKLEVALIGGLEAAVVEGGLDEGEPSSSGRRGARARGGGIEGAAAASLLPLTAGSMGLALVGG